MRGLSIDVPPELWAATTVVMDTITGAVSSDRAPLFGSIVIAAPLTPELAVAA